MITGPFVSADEVTALLAQAGLFEMALDVAKRFGLSTVPVFEALAARLVKDTFLPTCIYMYICNC